jgi:hypothetical protein
MLKRLLFALALLVAPAAFAQTSVTGRILEGPIGTRPPCVRAGDYFTSTDEVPVVEYKCTPPTWAAEAAGGGGGGTPAAPLNTLQKNCAGAFCASNLTELGGVLTNGDQNNNRGPNLGVDITFFGGRAVNPNSFGTTTGTITGGTNLLVVASSTNFQVNDGIVGLGMGATNCATQPSAPTAFAGLASAPTGTGWMVAGGTGSTSVSYAISAISQGNCYTAASPVVTVSNSSNSMGQNTLAITSQSIAVGSNLVTVTVGSTAGLATGFWGLIDGTSDNQEFGGYRHFTVVDGTHLSYQSTLDSRYYMTATTATGGTLYYKAGNHLTFPALPAGTNLYKWVVWRCIGASCALPANAASYSMVYVSYTANLGYTDTTYNTWDDFGTTMTPAMGAGFNADWFIPNTPPSSNINDALIAQITNIAGTTFTLSSNAINSATSSPVRFGNDYAVNTCHAAVPKTSTGGGGTCHWPPPVENPATGAFCYVTSSYLTFTGFLDNFGGVPCPTVTWNIGASNLNGTGEDGARFVFGNFGHQSLPDFNCRGANPCLLRAGAAIRNLIIESFSPQTILVFDTSGGPTVTENVHFESGSSASDYMTTLYYSYVGSTGSFGGTFNNTSWSMGPAQVVGATDTPAFISKNNSEWHFNYMQGNRRGFYFECNQPAINACGFYESMKMGEEWQGPITPLATFNSAVTGNLQGIVYLEHFFQDSGEMPLFVESNTVGSIGAPKFINQSNAPGNNMPIISGDAPNGGIALSSTVPQSSHQAGINHDLTQCNGQENIGPIATQGYTGCSLPSLNLATATYGVSHTLTGAEGVVYASAPGITFTLPHALAGQTWDIYNPTSGNITVTIDSGTLSGNSGTGPINISPNLGVRASCNGTNCSALGLGAGGVGTGIQNCLTDWLTTSTLGSICGSVTGAIPTYVNGNPPTALSPSMLDSPNSPVVTTPYTIACDTATTIVDRTRTVRFQSGAAAVTVPLSTASGCAGLVTTVFDDGAGTLTFTRSSPDTLTIVNGTTALDAQTSFNLTNGQYATLSQNASGLWLVRVAIGASAGVSSLTGDTGLFCNSGSTGAVTLVPCATTGAHKYWGNSTGSTGTASFNALVVGDLPTGIPNANLANTGTTVDGVVCTLGSTCTVGYNNIPAGALANGTSATTQSAGDNTTDVATDAFVTTAVSNAIAAVNPAVAVLAATTGSNLTGTYNNGTSGIGATLTITATGAFALDGVAINTIGQRVLLKDQTSAFQNGVYTATIVGTTGVSAVFTRALDYDQPSDINNTGAIPVVSGTVNAATSWLLTSTVNTVGTDALTYVQFSIAPSNIVVDTGNTTTTAAKVAISTTTAGKINYIDFPERYFIPAANCNNTTAGAGWSIGSGGTVTCRAGTNNKGGYVAITDTSSTFAQFTITIPEDWDTGTNPSVRFYFGYPGTDTGHTIIPAIQVTCSKGDGTTTDDVTFNAAHSSSTTTTNATANQFWSNSNVTMNSTDVTGCVAGAQMTVQVGRATDTATSAVNFYGADVTFPRLLTVGAE